MNSVIILPEELEGEAACVTGARAAYLYDTHELREGVEVQASVFGGRRGSAKVLSACREECRLALSLVLGPRVSSGITLIVAVPRPQTIKKVVQLSACMGIRSLHFLKTANVEKSYLQSKSLEENALQFESIKGLEQAFDSTPPEIEVHRDYWRFKKHVLPSLLGRLGGSATYILHTDSTEASQALRVASEQEVILAIGPESGWTGEEVADFEEHGFRQLSLGDRVLRVEHAAAFAISRIEYIRSMSIAHTRLS